MSTKASEVLADLVIVNQAHYDDVLAFACRTGRESQLTSKIDRLRNGGGQLRLYPDFAPYSFSFTREYPNGMVIGGGLIYHGPLEDGTHAETLAVTISPSDSWEIHT